MTLQEPIEQCLYLQIMSYNYVYTSKLHITVPTLLSRLARSGLQCPRLYNWHQNLPIMEKIGEKTKQKPKHSRAFWSSASPAGLTCLKDAAAGMSTASLSSFTSCQAFRASHKFMNPGAPLRTTHRNTHTH